MPASVAGISNAVSIAAGSSHACALLGDGTARCWGNNFRAALGSGDETSQQSPTPVPVVQLRDAVTLAAGNNNTCATLADDSLWCWGDNQTGVLGNDDPDVLLSAVPVRVVGL